MIRHGTLVGLAALDPTLHEDAQARDLSYIIRQLISAASIVFLNRFPRLALPLDDLQNVIRGQVAPRLDEAGGPLDLQAHNGRFRP
jgi:hypothetical protein